MPPHDLARADAKDACLAGGQIAAQVVIVLDPVRIRHQNLDVLADQLGGLVAEHSFDGGVDRSDDAGLVDRDQRVGHVLHDRADVALALPHGVDRFPVLRHVVDDAVHDGGLAVLVELDLALFVDDARAAVRQGDAMVETVGIAGQGVGDRLLNQRPVFGMDRVEERLVARFEAVGIAVEDAVDLFRPGEFTTRHVPIPVAQPRDALRVGQAGLAAAQR